MWLIAYSQENSTVLPSRTVSLTPPRQYQGQARRLDRGQRRWQDTAAGREKAWTEKGLELAPGEPEGPGQGASLIRGRLDRGSVLNDAEGVSWRQTHRYRLSFTWLSCQQSWNQQAVFIPRMTLSLSIPSLKHLLDPLPSVDRECSSSVSLHLGTHSPVS